MGKRTVYIVGAVLGVMVLIWLMRRANAGGAVDLSRQQKQLEDDRDSGLKKLTGPLTDALRISPRTQVSDTTIISHSPNPYFVHGIDRLFTTGASSF